MTDRVRSVAASRLCELCGVEVEPGAEADNIGTFAHRVCMLRMATGGIGHLLDHRFWCLQQHDPDGGRSRYQSALEVDQWIFDHGVDAALADSTDGIPHPKKANHDV